MSQSANSRKAAIQLRITRCARQLASKNGADDFTMDELADLAEVSRRTLFNYFPSKYDAILGARPDVDPDLRAQFRAGGPTGDLVDDLLVVVRHSLETTQETTEDFAAVLNLLRTSPRLLQHASERSDEALAECIEDFAHREGEHFDSRHVRATLAVLMSLLHAALEDLISLPAGKQPLLQDVVADYVNAARDIFSRTN